MGVARLYAALAHGRGRRPPLGDHRDRVPPDGRDAPAGHRPRAPARRCAGPPALDRAPQPVRRLAVRAPGPAARPAARAARRRPGARPGAPARPADRQRRRGRPPEHRAERWTTRTTSRCCGRGGVAARRRARRPGPTSAPGAGAFTLALADLLGPGATIVAVDRDRGARRRTPGPMAARFPRVGAADAAWPT